MESNTLKDKCILITGASRGIGKAIALACSSQGANVILTGRNTEKLEAVCQDIQMKGGKAQYFVFDLQDEISIQNNINTILHQVGDVDVLINNAGMGHWSKIDDTSIEIWDQVMNVNCRSTFLMCKLLLPHMYKKKQGHIINISSVMTTRSVQNLAAYISSKAAVDAFTKCLYAEAKQHNVKVTLLSPSQVDTEFRDNMTERAPMSSSQKAKMLQPADVADAIIWLLNTSPRSIPVSLNIEMQGEQ
ncbi:SDR family oxidoreductase [Bacillus sp. ISL-47]|uniref:SDR family NAD(P)-dependent oxidoreductase n=1 Tax=Bacillus sp. ISL-47 TaxID=2819130 RepID=UPI001BE50575|nr:SDR family oxidoreductase [Bacillus sp. ISL-47]MBT2686803.1 SDR family oxidoreductase [Bacillus sp. ISL-47]MBT2706844.1 SDR family oxidoreductase [Pseudomonas sp. ISL-84]